MGRVTARTYPSLPANTGRSFTYQYDLMGRLSGLTESGTSQATATYGPASELTNLTYYGYSEARTYNNLLQLTRQTVAGVFDTEYVFPAAQNNGQISASIDHISGQQVNYTYDLLKRLTAAATTGGTPWGEAYTYDGFGNLNAATVTQGSGVNWANASDPATNRLIGVPYDANGNNTTPLGPCCTTAYDAENRMVSQSTSSAWTYDPSNKRVAQANTYTWTLYFYDIFGKQIETVAGDVDYPNTPTTGTTNVYFGSKMIQAAGVTVVTDRLGSVRANSNGERFTYLPYGTEQTPTADGRVKFGTYVRDSTSPAQDYADQRYYNPWYGRFNSPDPLGLGAVSLSNPTSWNRYAYVGGDPANSNDPAGLTDVVIGGITNSSGDNGIDAFATSIHAIEAFPYAGGSTLGGVLAVMGLTLQEYTQAQTVALAIEAAAADSDAPINIFAFSGGATAFADALRLLPTDVESRINNVVYASPGIVGELPVVNGKAPTVIYGTGQIDQAVTSGASFPSGTMIIQSNCVGHSASCEFAYAANQAGTACNQCSAFSAPNLGVIDQIGFAGWTAGYLAAWGPWPMQQNGYNALDYLPLLLQSIEVVSSTFHPL